MDLEAITPTLISHSAGWVEPILLPAWPAVAVGSVSDLSGKVKFPSRYLILA